jgi:hypothetical protein
MKAGTEWEPALFEALKASQALVYLLSVDYLQSDNCGKELQAFRFRLAEYRRLAREKLRTAGATADHAKAQVDLQTPLVIQPVIWIPLSVSGLPPALRMLQADDDAFPKTYATQGLESLAKQRDKTAYRRCVDIIGNRVLQAAHGDPLPMLPGYSAYAEIPSAFASVKTVEPPAHQALPQSIPSGPTPLTCVYVAASDEEIRRYNAAAGDSSRAICRATAAAAGSGGHSIRACQSLSARSSSR